MHQDRAKMPAIKRARVEMPVQDVALHEGMGSFDHVRLMPHFAQDDPRGWRS